MLIGPHVETASLGPQHCIQIQWRGALKGRTVHAGRIGAQKVVSLSGLGKKRFLADISGPGGNEVSILNVGVSNLTC